MYKNVIIKISNVYNSVITSEILGLIYQGSGWVKGKFSLFGTEKFGWIKLLGGI